MSRNSNEVGKLLRNYQKLAGETQTSFACTLGVTQPAISRVMTGSYVPSSDWLNTVAMALNLSEEQRKALHRAAAKDHGYDIDLS